MKIRHPYEVKLMEDNSIDYLEERTWTRILCPSILIE
jgi:hypothetical protein